MILDLLAQSDGLTVVELNPGLLVWTALLGLFIIFAIVFVLRKLF